MALTRDIRRAALQALYQLDLRGDDAETSEGIRRSLAGSQGDAGTHERGFELARQAWQHRALADAIVQSLTSDWPTHRQPAIDRGLLRLAIYEMLHGRTPPKVAINEAVELAKEFSTERSPMFINGVLDKVFKQHVRDQQTTQVAAGDEDSDAADSERAD